MRAGLGRIDHAIELELAGGVECLALGVHPGHGLLEKGLSLGFVWDRFELFLETEPNGAFEAHSADFTGGPGEREERRDEGSTRHGLCAEAIALAKDHSKERNGDVGARDKEARDLANLTLQFDFRSDHEAGRVAERQHRDSEGVAELQKASRLFGSGVVDRTTEMHGVIRDQSQCSALDANECGDHANAVRAPEFENRAFITQGFDDFTHIVDSPSVFGNQMTQLALIVASPILGRALEIGQITFGGRDGFDLVFDEQIDDAGGFEKRGRSDFLRVVNPESSAFDHGWSAHAKARVLSGNDDVGTACEGRTASEAESRDDADARNLQQFLTHSKWRHRDVIEHVGRDVSEELGSEAPCGLIIDESSFEKQGKESAGVSRQWLGRLGKVDNGQVGVFGVLASGTRVAPVDGRLYLPKKWCDDEQRCEKAGIPPEERVFRTKIELALKIVEDSRRNGLHSDWVGADAGYGKGLAFIEPLAKMGEVFVVDLHSDFTIYEDNPKPYLPEKKATGRPPRLWKSRTPPMEVSKYVASLDKACWKRVLVRDTTRGPMRLEVAVAPVYVWDATMKKEKKYRIVATRSLEHDELKISLTNAKTTTSRKRLAFMQRQRFWVERAFEDGKSECGMADYQCRKWAAWHHHMALVIMSMAFLLKERGLQQETHPLLSAADIEILLAKFLPRRDTSPREVIRQLEERHRRRRGAIASHSRKAEQAYRRIKRSRTQAVPGSGGTP